MQPASQHKQQSDKKVNSKRRKSYFTEAHFFADLCHLSKHGQGPAELLSLVGVGLDKASPVNFKRGRTRRFPLPPLSTYYVTPNKEKKKPPLWRDTSQLTKAFFSHLAIMETGQAVGVTVNLSSEIERLARANKKGALDYIRRRIDRYFKAIDGLCENWWFCIEETDCGRLHLHGELSASEDENDRRRIRRALRRAAGEWSTNRQRQVHFTEINNYGWHTYVTKRLNLTEKRARKSNLREHGKLYMRASFEGPGFTMARMTRKRTVELFEMARQAVIAERQKIARKKKEPCDQATSADIQSGPNAEAAFKAAGSTPKCCEELPTCETSAIAIACFYRQRYSANYRPTCRPSRSPRWPGAPCNRPSDSWCSP
ncbi:hypothetical protein [Roseibium alexandrii]|uniref:Uncharacterized protein n=1 Tax=Roseibium alexandrii (strain DSM 17067 / NCIMB 14079 / DFL-11) TaxID=244592 RepID=A0A5E8H1U2_ROSAD|nr:hypothetical protein [Roseibium alexandrii]EEE45896.2 hypothetical protein SADFL11_3185 [Roseibium alexandrii DFL-11]